MPTGGRKSSFGRTQPQRHVPYSMDNAAQGRHGTNIPRQSVASDGYEDFEAINDMDPTPPRPARVRRRSSMNARPRKSKAREEVEDEDVFGGEESMELDDDEPVSRMRNARQHPDSARSARTISRRASDVDYDALPSPPQRSQRRSSAYSSVLPSEYDPEPDQDMGDVPYFDDDDIPPISNGDATPTPRAKRRESFSEMGEEDEEEEQPPTPVPVSKKGKGKRAVEDMDDEVQEGPSMRVTGAQRGKGKGKEPIRTVEEEVYDNDMEDAISRGMDEVENMNLDEDDGMQEDDPPPVSASPPKKKRARPPKKVAVTPVFDEETPDPQGGPRRGTRQRYAPLEWWRNEKVVYGRRENGISYCPIVKAIVRVPKEPPKPLGKHAPKRKGSQRRTPAPGVANPEEGWDDQTEPLGIVLDWNSKTEVERRIAFPSSHVEYKAASDEMFFFQKIFGDAEYMAAGQLLIPVGGAKPTKTTKDNTYVFYIIEGAVTFKVHETSYILCTGGSILVPRGNTYYIENISDRDAKIFFAQARRVLAEDEPAQDVKPASARPTSTPADDRASGSATPVATGKGKGKKAGGGKKR